MDAIMFGFALFGMLVAGGLFVLFCLSVFCRDD